MEKIFNVLNTIAVVVLIWAVLSWGEIVIHNLEEEPPQRSPYNLLDIAGDAFDDLFERG